MGTRRVFGSITAGSNGARVQWPAREEIATQRTTLRQIQGLVDGWLSTNLKPIGLSGVGVLSDRNHHMSTTPA